MVAHHGGRRRRAPGELAEGQRLDDHGEHDERERLHTDI
jgi:hypothetical protein